MWIKLGSKTPDANPIYFVGRSKGVPLSKLSLAAVNDCDRWSRYKMRSIVYVAFLGLAMLSVCLGMLSFSGRPEHHELSSQFNRPPVQLQCPANESRFWGSHEQGCKGFIPISGHSCICAQGLYRRETDRACVPNSGCPRRCPQNEMISPGAVAEHGCNGNVSVRPGGCVCHPGFFRRQDDRACVTSCAKTVTIIVPGVCESEAAARLCKKFCPPAATFTWNCSKHPRPGDKSSVACACQTS